MKQALLIFLLTLVTTFTVTAQDNSDENSCPGWLWAVSGNGLTQKSYLFGTCHGDGHKFSLEEMYSISGLSDALGKVEKVLFEGGMNPINTVDNNEELEKLKKWVQSPGPEWMMPEGTYYKPLYDSAAHFTEVNKFLYYKMKDPEYWKKRPGYWYGRLFFYSAFARKGQEMPIDILLRQEVEKRGIETGQVETNNEMSGSLFSMLTNTTAIDTLSMKGQAYLLYVLIHALNNDSIESWRGELSKVYLENDTCKMGDYMRSIDQVPGAESEEDKNHTILYDRNVKWMSVIKENFAACPCMVAVGCRHLLGSESLIAMLQREGYTVEAVK
jgi:uncharacterized protein YbaP (TraB family)